MVIAVVFVVILAFLASTLVSMYMRSTEATRRLQAIPAAASLAESGIEQANSYMTSYQSACGNLPTSPTTTLSSGNFTEGTFSITGADEAFAYSTLSTAIANNTTPSTITLASTNSFAQSGWVMIGREVFAYSSIVNSTTLGGITRAQNASLATAHVVNELVSQYQCSPIVVTGTVTDSNNTNTPTLASRTYQQNLGQPQLHAVGSNSTILIWNNPPGQHTWDSIYNNGSRNLNAVSALNVHSVWAAGDNFNSNSAFMRLQGTTWTNFTQNVGANTDLMGIYATSEGEAWAAGLKGNNTINLLRWTRDASNNNANWCALSTVACSGVTLNQTGISTADMDLEAIKAIDTNGDGFADAGYAVGGSTGTGLLLSYANSIWSNATIGSNPLPGKLNGVDVTPNGSSAPIEAFFVGLSSSNSLNGILIRLQIIAGTPTWTTITSINGTPIQALQAVSVMDTDGDGLADIGCATGANGQVIVFTNTFAPTASTLGSGNVTLNSALVLNSEDIWVAGNSGMVSHFDGTLWSDLAQGANGHDLYGLTGVLPTPTNFNSPQASLSGWQEIIN